MSQMDMRKDGRENFRPRHSVSDALMPRRRSGSSSWLSGGVNGAPGSAGRGHARREQSLRRESRKPHVGVDTIHV